MQNILTKPVAQVVAVEPPGADGHGVNWLQGKRPQPGDLLYAAPAAQKPYRWLVTRDESWTSRSTPREIIAHTEAGARDGLRPEREVTPEKGKKHLEPDQWFIEPLYLGAATARAVQP